MGKVVRLVRPKSFTTSEAFLEEVREKIFMSHIQYKTLANKADVSISTIHNLASGKTMWPRPKTLFGILGALGYKLQLEEGTTNGKETS